MNRAIGQLAGVLPDALQLQLRIQCPLQRRSERTPFWVLFENGTPTL
jgi:hypothetical protein